MNKKKLIFIESNTSGTGSLFIKEAIKQGFEAVLFTKNPLLYSFINKDIEVVETDTFSEEDLTDICNDYLEKDEDIAGITSSSEYFIYIAARLANKFKLPSPMTSAISNCRNKYTQRKILQDANVGIPKFYLAQSIEEVIAFSKEFELPVIIKPTQGSGSFGVKMCSSLEEIREHSKFLLNQKVNERGIASEEKILIEELVNGDEYSVETFNNSIIGITKKHLGELPNFVEIGHDFPAKLTYEEEQSIKEITIKALDSLNLKWGANHIELRLTKYGAKIIEVNPRLAGGYIPELIRFAYGINLISEMIKLTTGQVYSIERTKNQNSVIRFILPETQGKLISIQGIEDIKNTNGIVDVQIYKKIGEYVSVYGDFRDRIGHIIACANDETSIDIVEAALKKINLVIE